jgi:hypothetical protein
VSEITARAINIVLAEFSNKERWIKGHLDVAVEQAELDKDIEARGTLILQYRAICKVLNSYKET